MNRLWLRSCPLIWYEVFGIVILESFTQKTPVIVSNMGGMPKVVKSSGGGFVFDTEMELVAAMDRLLHEAKPAGADGTAGLSSAATNGARRYIFTRYLGLIEESPWTGCK